MRLNLGCGRALLPTNGSNPYTTHLTQYLPPSAYTEKWVNVDKVLLSGIDEVCDLFAYPWVRGNGNPWSDDSADEIWASHLIEHIPHEAKLIPGADRTLKKAAQIDGWFAWFYEAWRILKPDGLLHLVIPWPMGRPGMADPTHRRYVHPGAFSYFSPNPDAPFDYQIPIRFELAEPIIYRFAKVELLKEALAAEEKKAKTEGKKEGDEGWPEVTAELILGVADRYSDAVDEYCVRLRAVKT